MVNKSRLIEFNNDAGAWTDGQHYVKGSIIRRYSMESLGRKVARGRLSREEISAYWLDRYGVDADVA